MLLLDDALRSVPMLATLGVRTDEVEPGRVVLRLPVSNQIVSLGGALHTSALFAVGELAAATVLGTHPELADLDHFLKSSRVKYYASSHHDVTAHAELPSELAASLVQDLDRAGTASVEIPVSVRDGHGRDVAQVVSHFSLRAAVLP